MDFDLTEGLAAVRELAREFAEKEIAPKAAAAASNGYRKANR